MTSPFHAGEQGVQERLGVRGEIEPWARQVVREFLPDPHRDFYESLPFLVAAARDKEGRPWTTLLVGAPGFLQSPDPKTLVVNALPVPGDALDGALEGGADVGLLGILLESARRNRINGRVRTRGEHGFTLEAGQTFGNCPQYIRDRRVERVEPAHAPAPSVRSERLSPTARKLIQQADTFFIGTGHPGAEEGDGDHESFGMDASHRGGEPGFVHVRGDQQLVFPDYKGNNHFNTLGNLELDPRAGLLFVDFETGGLLQLTGRAEVEWQPTDVSEFPGARRLVHFEIDEAIELPRALPIRWRAPEGETVSLRLAEKIRESTEITSFVFENSDGEPLPPFEAGQHLPIELDVLGHDAPVFRTYSLSGSPAGGRYRISVKREARGIASRHLHDTLEPGGVIRASAPRGDFTLAASRERPVALVSAGVGLTPMVSMLCERVLRGTAPTWFVHGARDGRHHALREEVEALAATNTDTLVRVAYSRPREGDEPARDYHTAGRVDATQLEALIPGLDADFYLCGPAGFLAEVTTGLEARGVPSTRIHFETF